VEIKSQHKIKMIDDNLIKKSSEVLRNNGVIAYPTEAIYGLGCDIYSESAIKRILDMKQRPSNKGLIIVASSWQQVSHLTTSINHENLTRIMESWPSHTTWVFPASPKSPKLITGAHDSIAIRITNHPIVSAICEEFSGPIVSTSANIQAQQPARTSDDTIKVFGNKIDFVYPGVIKGNNSPSKIIDATTLKVLRL
jgi:L-threonylcarbamoyladenylate synthase